MKIARNCLVTLRQLVSDADGRVIDDGAHPIAYVHGGYDDIFEAIERELAGKSIGDRISVTLDPEETFGLYDEALCKVVPLDHFPSPPRAGDQVESTPEEGGVLFLVHEVTGEGVHLDGNHPLAGHVLTFQAEILDVRPATQEEVIRASRAVHIGISRWRALKGIFVSFVAAPVMLLMIAGLLVEWLGSGILAYGVLAFGVAVLLAVLWRGLGYVREMWRGGQVLRIDVQGIQGRDFKELVPWEAIAKVKRESFGDDVQFTVCLADTREFHFDSTILTVETPQISWLFAQYLPAAKLEGW